MSFILYPLETAEAIRILLESVESGCTLRVLKKFIMTLEDTDQNTLVHSTEKQNNNNKMDLSESLTDVIVKAVADDRVTFGVYDSARKLDKESENVLVCIQVEDTNLDVALEMHLTLLEAFCSESEIKLVKVTNHEHLVQLLDSVRAKHKSGRDLSSDDVVCMVIEEPNETDDTCVSFTEIYHTQEYIWHPHVAL